MSIPLRKTSLDVFAVREEAFEVVYWCKDFVAGVFMFYSSVPRVNVKPEVRVGKKKNTNISKTQLPVLLFLMRNVICLFVCRGRAKTSSTS
jgi:hypothetical protein